VIEARHTNVLVPSRGWRRNKCGNFNVTYDVNIAGWRDNTNGGRVTEKFAVHAIVLMNVQMEIRGKEV
jgi:hypothetical protein